MYNECRKHKRNDQLLMNIGEMHKTRDDNKLPKKKQDIKSEVKGQILHVADKGRILLE